MQIAENMVVSIDYILKDDDGNILDSSQGHEPLTYLHGQGDIIPGLESALEGKTAGDKISVKILPEDAYGEYDDELIQIVPRSNFGGIDDIEVGMQFQAEGEYGVQVVTVTAIEGDDISVDANHPLAGVNLNFDVSIINIRPASSEEIEHGHAHGPGGHHHH